jgi:hypothetical protein
MKKVTKPTKLVPKATPATASTPLVDQEPLTHRLKPDGTIVELTEDEKKKLAEEDPK